MRQQGVSQVHESFVVGDSSDKGVRGIRAGTSRPEHLSARPREDAVAGRTRRAEGPL